MGTIVRDSKVPQAINGRCKPDEGRVGSRLQVGQTNFRLELQRDREEYELEW